MLAEQQVAWERYRRRAVVSARKASCTGGKWPVVLLACHSPRASHAQPVPLERNPGNPTELRIFSAPGSPMLGNCLSAFLAFS